GRSALAAAPDRDVFQIKTIDPDAVPRRIGPLQDRRVLAVCGEWPGQRDRGGGSEKQTAGLGHAADSTAYAAPRRSLSAARHLERADARRVRRRAVLQIVADVP